MKQKKWTIEAVEVPNPVKKKSYYYMKLTETGTDNFDTYVMTKTNYENLKKQLEWKPDSEAKKSTGE